MRTLVLIAALTAPTLLSATPATAQKTRTVSMAGLDLSSPADIRKLDRRIARAVEAVCGSYASISANQNDRITDCRRGAIANVKRQLAARHSQGTLATAAR